MINNSQIQGTDGSITIEGIGGVGSSSEGLFVRDGSLISVNGLGAVEITGSGDSTSGLVLEGDVLTQSGNILLQGTSVSNVGLVLTSTATIGGATATGNLTLQADSLSVSGATLQSTGNFFLEPLSAGVTLGLGDGAGGSLFFDTASINSLASNFGGLSLGSLTMGAVDIRSLTLTNPFSVLGGSIGVNGAIVSGANNFSLTAARNITLNSGSSITSTSGNISLIANSAGTATGNFAGVSFNNATVQSTTGAIVLSGKGGNTGDEQMGILIRSNSRIESLATGTAPSTSLITLTGTGGNGNNGNYGIGIQSGSQILSQSGGVTLQGTGNGSSLGIGIDILGGSSLNTQSGNINLTGTGGSSAGGSNIGVVLTAPISTVDGAINIIGTGNGTGASNYGIYFNDSASQVISTGTGTIALRGVGAGSGNTDNDGINMANNSLIQGNNGSVTVTGIAGAGNSEGISI
jgi:hypothetical protein